MSSVTGFFDITALPVELQLYIFSFLPWTSLKNLSLLDKNWRQRTIPLVFKRIMLYPENISIFSSNPTLCAAVKRVSLRPVLLHDDDGEGNELAHIDYWRICAPALSLFPNLTGLRMLYLHMAHAIIRSMSPDARGPWERLLVEYDSKLFNAIFSTLATLPFYKTQLISLQMLFGMLDNCRYDTEYPLRLTDAQLDFLHTTDRVKRDMNIDYIPFPPALEDVILHTGIINLPNNNPIIYTVLNRCQRSLRSCNLLSYLVPRTPTPHDLPTPALGLAATDNIFENVTVLCVSSMWLAAYHLDEIVRTFPNLQDLRANDASHTRYETPSWGEYQHCGYYISGELLDTAESLSRFKSLRKLVLPWPMSALEHQNHDWAEAESERSATRLTIRVEILEKIVKAWVNRLKGLERVSFWHTWKRPEQHKAVVFEREGRDEAVRVGEVYWSEDWEEVLATLADGWTPAYGIDHDRKTDHRDSSLLLGNIRRLP